MRRATLSIAAAAVVCALGASPVLAGQIVWIRAAGSTGGQLWAANDDGTYPHRLLTASSGTLATQFPGGTLDQPDVFQAGGTSIVFTDTEGGFATSGDTATCTDPCTDDFMLAAGALTPVSPAPATAGAAFETQPRLTGSGAVIARYELYPAATPDSLGAPTVQGLFESAPGGGAFGPPWADTATATLPLRADPAPDPANAGLLAWVESQDPTCSRFTVRGAPVCQYAIDVAGGSTTAPPVAIYDDETPTGAGPSSLAWSTDGRSLLIVDDTPPNDGIYEVSASTAVPPASKQVIELISEPSGWMFGQARFAGSRIVFDAAGNGRWSPAMSDIYSIPASCDSGTCSFPASATDLTRDPAADNIAPAWTSAAAPLAPLGATPVAGAPAVLDAAAILARTVQPKTGVGFEVTLSAPGSLSVSISRNGHTIGTTTERLAAGANRFTVRQSGGHALTPGSDVAKLRLGGSTAVRYSASFTVR